jgi:hypothetical protein
VASPDIGGTSPREADDDLEEVRSLLESITLLETVASEREARVASILNYMAERGMTARQLARRLDISLESVQVLLDREEPRPPHERAGLSEESIEKLGPLGG